MQVVLVQDYPQLGVKGSVMNVKPGFFRNFLMPQGIAKIAKDSDIEAFAKMAEEREAKRREMLSQAASLVVDLDGQTVLITARASESGSLYANVHESDVAHAINERFQSHIAAKDVTLKEQIKSTGPHPVTVVLTPEHKATMTVVVENAA